MKRILVILTAVIFYILPYTTYAQSFSLYSTPKIGMELGNRILKWQENMGKNHFAENLPQIDLFVEIPIFEQFSLKFGHERTIKRKSTAPYADGTIVLNSVDNPLFGDATYATTSKLVANYIDAVYNYTLLKTDSYTTKFTVFLGLSRGQLKLTQENVSVPNITDLLSENLTTSKKTYLRKGIGLQSLLNNGVGFNVGITHERTSKLKSILVTDTDTYMAEARNSIIFSIGISYQL
jgi:hypothetical protein